MVVLIAARKTGVFEGNADVEGDSGVEAKGLVNYRCEVFHALEVVVGRSTVGAESMEDFGAEFANNIRVL